MSIDWAKARRILFYPCPLAKAGGNSLLDFDDLLFHSKLVILIVFALFAIACFSSKPQRYSIATSKSYEASLFRQHCAICHGPEGEGRTLDDGKVIPNMREGDLLKFHTEAEIYKQIAGGGNGMTPFRDILTERELNLMAKFVHDELRKSD